MEISAEIDGEKHIDEPKKKSEIKKRKRSKIDEDADVASSKKKKLKGILLSVTKPSYTLKRGIGPDLRSLRSEHRIRLRYLLRQLIRRQNWDEASGVLSLVLMGTRKDGSFASNRTKYSTALKILEHMGAKKKMDQVYSVWMTKDSAIVDKKQSLKGRSDVMSEFLLFRILQGDSGAYDTVISLQQESAFSKDPIANLVVGLYFSHQWYNDFQKEVHLHDSLESNSPIQSGMSEARERLLINHSNAQSAVEVQDSGSAFQPGSDTSIRIGKEIVVYDREVRMEVDHKVKKEVLEFEEPHMNSSENDQNGIASRFMHTGNMTYGSIVYAQDLDYFLMPLKLPRTSNLEDFISLQRSIQNDHYKAAVKHLQNALHSTPPISEALLPLIQMLLLGDQVKEAIEEVESVVQNSNAALPFRLKASLLEHFSKEDANKLCICFENTLRKDPTCRHSLLKLINLHHVGDYGIERLVEMIALHLDATYADCDIWKEFASCFMKLSECDEDRMSTCVNSYGDSYTKFSQNVPDMFQSNMSKKNWRLRCRWWLTRHFSRPILISEVDSGNLELVAYKAATACHLYGPDFAYVVTADAYLKKEHIQETAFLKMHLANAIGITQHNMGSPIKRSSSMNSASSIG